MKISEIKDLMTSFEQSGCTSFEVQQDNFVLKLEKKNQLKTVEIVSEPVVKKDLPSNEVIIPEDDGEIVKSPLVGVFYAAPKPDAKAYVQVGTRVEKGQVLCLIEAMKMMSEITAPKDGVIQKIYVKNQDVVGFEDPLFSIGD